MQRQLGRLVPLVGRRGYFLLFLALLDMVYAFSLAFPGSETRYTPTLRFLDSAGSLYFWAALWAAVGITCFVFAFRRTDWPGFAAAMLIKVLWAIMFFVGWVFVHIDRGYLTAAVWAAFGLLVWLISTWPEPEDEQERKMKTPK